MPKKFADDSNPNITEQVPKDERAHADDDAGRYSVKRRSSDEHSRSIPRSKSKFDPV